MRERLRRFAMVGLIATAVDVGLVVVLLDCGWSVVAADIVALAAAAVVARPLHRVITLRDDPFARWIRIRRVFVSVVVADSLEPLSGSAAGAAVATSAAMKKTSINRRSAVRTGLAMASASVSSIGAGEENRFMAVIVLYVWGAGERAGVRP